MLAADPASVNSHHLLRASALQFGLDDRMQEPVVPLPAPDRKGRRWSPFRPRRHPEPAPDGGTDPVAESPLAPHSTHTDRAPSGHEVGGRP